VAGHIYSLERIQPLLTQARERFQELQLRNIRTNYADGTIGWPDQAPFDAIIATAAPEQIPRALLEQLKVGGRLIIPVGKQGLQQLTLITRTDDEYEQQILETVSFVPMLPGSS
jgi:protein-L-isoaspartate(D-aspartate) O-methyltransferase